MDTMQQMVELYEKYYLAMRNLGVSHETARSRVREIVHGDVCKLRSRIDTALDDARTRGDELAKRESRD